MTGSVNLSEDDINFLVNGLGIPPQAIGRLTSNVQDRQDFLHDLKEMFALAEEARAAGLDVQPETKIQLELARSFVIARNYAKKRQDAGATTQEQVVSKEEIAAFLKEPGQGKNFEEFLQDYQRNGRSPQSPALTDAERNQLQQQWANVMLGSRKGLAAGLDKERATQVMLMYQQARLLASKYFKDVVSARAKATEAETDAYLAAHPELDPKHVRAKAEDVLRRVRAGEDFVKLADELTEDPSGKGKGGELGWFGRGAMVKPFEDAAFNLKPGEVSEVVETQFGFHVIKVDDRGMKPGADGKPAEQVRARHILLSFGSGARRNNPPLPPRDQARAAVEKEKAGKLIEEIVKRSRVRVPTDFMPELSVIAPAPAATNAPAPKTGGARPTTSSGKTKRTRP